MTCYRVLSKPLSRKAPYGYRGIARQEPVFREEDGDDIWSLTTTAIYSGKNVQLIRYLLDHGGKIDYNSSYSGQSFYDYCHEEGRERILSIIEEKGGFPEDIED